MVTERQYSYRKRVNLSHFNKNDIISVTVPCELKIDIEVKP